MELLRNIRTFPFLKEKKKAERFIRNSFKTKASVYIRTRAFFEAYTNLYVRVKEFIE